MYTMYMKVLVNLSYNNMRIAAHATVVTDWTDCAAAQPLFWHLQKCVSQEGTQEEAQGHG